MRTAVVWVLLALTLAAFAVYAQDNVIHFNGTPSSSISDEPG